MSKLKVSIQQNILLVTMLVLSLIVLFPIIYTLISCFKTKTEINNPLSLPTSLYLMNFSVAWTKSNFPLLFLNSAMVAVLSVSIIVLIGSIASYPLGRKKTKGFRIVYFLFLSGMMIPFQSGMIPLYGLIRVLNLMNTQFVLILVGVVGAIPITVLVYTGFITTIPKELEEASKIDGCSYVGIFFRIIFPLLKPATSSVIILTTMPIWNDFMSPLLFISDAKRRTIPVGVYMFMGDRSSDFGPIFAITVMALIVPVILFLNLQKYFYKGITAGAVKG